MLVAAQSRGTDAAGLYVLNEGGECYVYSAQGSAETLVTSLDYWAVLDMIGPTTIAVVGHTRAATTGSPSFNENNHSVVDGNLVGVHNGVITNHRSLRSKYGAAADVDSAVILSLLNSRLVDGDYLSQPHLVHSLKELDGSFAIAVADKRQERIFLARNAGSPMEIASNKGRATIWFASTKEIIAKGLNRSVSTATLPIGSIAELTRSTADRVAQGKVLKWAPFIQRKVSRPMPSWREQSLIRNRYPIPTSSDSYQPAWFPFFDEGAGMAEMLRKSELAEKGVTK